MKILLFFLIIFTLNCVGGKDTKVRKIYICGDHECENKKEVEEYFKSNISIEVYTINTSSKKNMDYDLVQLNMSDKDKKELISVKDMEKNIKQKLDKRKKETKISVIQDKKKDEIQIDIKKKRKLPVTLVRLCKNSDECDIDEISQIIFDKGRDKKYPNLTIY